MEYFPGIYPWNLSMQLALNMGGVPSEIMTRAARLAPYRSAGDPGAWEDWRAVWAEAADAVAALAAEDEAAGHPRSAGTKYLRAALYDLLAERMMTQFNEARRALYVRALDRFNHGLALRHPNAERVEIPCGHTSLPAIYSPPDSGAGPFPCMVFWPGFDVGKELLFYRAIREELNARGIAVLMVDIPGTGEALRLRGLHATPETEGFGAACMDWVETRNDIDARRTGIMGVSLGGYYAPRAACFEHRFACCVAWGAVTNFGSTITQQLATGERATSVTDILDHARWVFGTDSDDALRGIMGRMTLDEALPHLACALLVTHGLHDKQVPVEQARALYQAATSARSRELKIFTEREGGVEHVNFDNVPVVVDYMADWITDHLR